jgi:hypothetical protein
MGLKWKSASDDLVKASFREFPLKDPRIGVLPSDMVENSTGPFPRSFGAGF